MNPAEFAKPGGGSIVLKPLRRGDLDAVIGFAQTLVAERKVNWTLGIVSLDRNVTWNDEATFLERTLSGLRRGDFVGVAAFDGDRLVGNCDVAGRRSRDVRHTGVLGIAIIDGYRGFGLGRAMMGAALKQAARLGIWLVELEVFADNDRAKHLYEDLGFRMVGAVPGKILRHGRSIDPIMMYIDLRGTDKSTKWGRRPS